MEAVLALIGLVITLAVVILAVAVAISISIWLFEEEKYYNGKNGNPCKGGLEHESLADRISEYEESAEVPH